MEPMEWCTGAHFVDKQNGKVRLVNDLTALNKYTKRPVHGFSSSAELREGILHMSWYFCVLDCVQGYHQLKLDEESSLLTTFMVSTGDRCQRYWFIRAPMGLNASGDMFFQRTDDTFLLIQEVSKLVDDVLVQGDMYEQLVGRVEEVLVSAREHGLTMSRSKMQPGR